MNHVKWFLKLIIIGMLFFGLSPDIAPAQETTTLPLAERGPYGVGMLDFTFVDESRDGRELTGLIWYPAQAGRSSYLMPEYQAAPDPSAAPYPLIIYSHGLWGGANSTLGMASHLASYGFVVVSTDHNDPENVFGQASTWINHTNRPMDVLFVLNQLDATSDEGALAGVISTEHVGVTGYSYGGFTTVLVSGARLDPASLWAYCDDENHHEAGVCVDAEDLWEPAAAYRAQFDPPPVEGEPWPAYTDDRIAAVMPMAPCTAPLFGERGLASTTLPTLVVGLTEDEMCPYERDAAYIYKHLGSTDRALLTMFNMGHIEAIEDSSAHEVFNHFAVAFFGYHLQGKADYAQYLTSEFVSGFDNLQWASSIE